MKSSRLLEERVRRVRVLFRELGYNVKNGDREADTFTASFENRDGFQGALFVDRNSHFVELGFTFAFSPTLAEFVRQRLEQIVEICYEYGCYMNLQKAQEDFSFSIFSKIYYSGLNYFSLRDTLREFRWCVESLSDLLEIKY